MPPVIRSDKAGKASTASIAARSPWGSGITGIRKAAKGLPAFKASAARPTAATATLGSAAQRSRTSFTDNEEKSPMKTIGRPCAKASVPAEASSARIPAFSKSSSMRIVIRSARSGERLLAQRTSPKARQTVFGTNSPSNLAAQGCRPRRESPAGRRSVRTASNR